MAKGLDAPKTLAPIAHKLVRDGYMWVARYYFNQSRYKDLLTHDEAVVLSSAGLFVVSVWENGLPTTEGYFSAKKGTEDASDAMRKAIAAKQPYGTPIYFAVDGDVRPEKVISYFDAIADRLNQSKLYTAGAYGSGAVIAELEKRGLVTHSWLSQSRGWRGYENGLKVAEIVQGKETIYEGRDVDLDWSNGRAGGWKVLV